nr:macro domain-containing protein [Kordiimonas lipolytica]
MFDDPSEAIVNTVNCVGVMGKGVALEFKRRWPENFKAYKKLCDQKQLSPGHMFIYDNGGMLVESGPRYLINFPTKQHWRAKSKMSYISEGLDDFVIQVQKLGIKSVAVPPLGCGNGGLPWNDVRKVIESKLAGIDGVDFVVYAPKNHFSSPEYENIPPKMTLARAALVKAVGDFEVFFGGHLTRISLQKIIYFLQALGVPFNLKFTRNTHGPYSESLNTILSEFERLNYISGFSKAEAEIQATRAAYSQADEFLSSERDTSTNEIIQKLGLLIEGYESPFGMELLASVHYLHEVEGIHRKAEIISAIKSWNDHKSRNFTDASISTAFLRLNEDGLIQAH